MGVIISRQRFPAFPVLRLLLLFYFQNVPRALVCAVFECGGDVEAEVPFHAEQSSPLLSL